MHEVKRHPVQHQPEDPVVAEVHAGDRQQAAIKTRPCPRHFHRTYRRRRQAADLFRRDARMIRRLLGVCHVPQHQPAETQRAEQVKRESPVERRHQRQHQHRRHSVAEPRRGMRNALGHAAFILSHPRRHRARGGGEGGAFAQTQQQSRRDKRREAACETRQRGRHRPDKGTENQRALGPEAVADPAADELEQHIRIRES